MTVDFTASRSRARLIVWSIVLTLTLLTSTIGGTAASTLMPMTDAGGPGGGGGAASGILDETDRAIALGEISGVSDTAVLVGSGPERETVAQSDGTVAASSGMSDTDRAAILVAIGGNGQPAAAAVAGDPAFALTENERSIQLIESMFAPGGYLAGGTAPPARVAYEDSEHAVAQTGGEDTVTVQGTGVRPF